jgi:hypothetical protein
MKEQFSLQELDTIIAHQGKPAVTIYLPTSRIVTRVQAESLQLKNLLRIAGEQLEELGLPSPLIRQILAPAQALVKDAEFWRQQKEGIAIFLAEDMFRCYQVTRTFVTQVIVAETFHVKPLLPLLTNDSLFYILAVSQNDVRLLRGSRDTIREIEPSTIPTSLAEMLRYNDPERQLHVHTSSTPPGTGRSAAIFHSNGSGAIDGDKEQLQRFFSQINVSLMEFLQDQNQKAPLVFAGLDSLLPIYREANTYPHLVELGIRGNHSEHIYAEELHGDAWRLVAPIFAADRMKRVEEFNDLISSGRTATHLCELIPAADQGRVATAFVAANECVWGVYDAKQSQVIVHESKTLHNRDLTDLFAIYTLLRGGDVYIMSNQDIHRYISTESSAAAIYRD